MSDPCGPHGRPNFFDLRSRDINGAKHGAEPLSYSQNATTLASQSRGTGCFPDPWLSPHQHTIAAFAEVSADLQMEEH